MLTASQAAPTSKALEYQACQRLCDVGAHTKERVQCWCIRQGSCIVGEAPEEQAKADVAKELRHAEERSERPVAQHAHQAREARGEPLQAQQYSQGGEG